MTEELLDIRHGRVIGQMAMGALLPAGDGAFTRLAPAVTVWKDPNRGCRGKPEVYDEVLFGSGTPGRLARYTGERPAWRHKRAVAPLGPPLPFMKS